MPLPSFDTKAERDISINNYARWSAARGVSEELYTQRAYDRYGGKFYASINQAYDFADQARKAGRLAMSGLATGTLRSSTIPSTVTSPTMLRVTVDINLAGNAQTGLGGRVFFGLTIDIPYSRNKADIRAAAETAVMELLAQSYDTRQRGFPKGFKAFNITSLEGF